MDHVLDVVDKVLVGAAMAFLAVGVVAGLIGIALELWRGRKG